MCRLEPEAERAEHPSYSPKCVEGKFSEVHIQHPASIAGLTPFSVPGAMRV